MVDIVTSLSSLFCSLLSFPTNVIFEVLFDRYFKESGELGQSLEGQALMAQLECDAVGTMGIQCPLCLRPWLVADTMPGEVFLNLDWPNSCVLMCDFKTPENSHELTQIKNASINWSLLSAYIRSPTCVPYVSVPRLNAHHGRLPWYIPSGRRDCLEWPTQSALMRIELHPSKDSENCHSNVTSWYSALLLLLTRLCIASAKIHWRVRSPSSPAVSKQIAHRIVADCSDPGTPSTDSKSFNGRIGLCTFCTLVWRVLGEILHWSNCLHVLLHK